MPPATLPNHSWCVGCTSQHPLENLTKCTSLRCRAKYCKKCILEKHAQYSIMPNQRGEFVTPMPIPKCRYCHAPHRVEFFKASKCVPINLTNVATLRSLRQDIRLNYLLDTTRTVRTEQTQSPQQHEQQQQQQQSRRFAQHTMPIFPPTLQRTDNV